MQAPTSGCRPTDDSSMPAADAQTTESQYFQWMNPPERFPASADSRQPSTREISPSLPTESFYSAPVATATKYRCSPSTPTPDCSPTHIRTSPYPLPSASFSHAAKFPCLRRLAGANRQSDGVGAINNVCLPLSAARTGGDKYFPIRTKVK